MRPRCDMQPLLLPIRHSLLLLLLTFVPAWLQLALHQLIRPAAPAHICPPSEGKACNLGLLFAYPRL